MQDVSPIGRGALVGIAALAALCLSALGSAAPSVNGLTINVIYTATSLSAKLSNGTVLDSGTVVPPGPYSVIVYDSDNANPQFTLTGPGVSVSSDLSPNGNGIEVPVTFGPFVFEPSSSYALYDANLSGPHIAFTTAATGTSASQDSSSGSSKAGSGKTLGTLALFVTATGRPLLTLGGKPVTKLAAGKYSVIVGDQSRTAGLVLGHGTAAPTTLSGTAAVGAHVRSLVLTAGKWFFAPSAKGHRTYFTVT